MKNTKLLQLKRRYQTSLRKNSRTDELATSLTSVKHVIDRHTNDENVRVTYVKERKICILLATLLIGRVKWDLYPHMASVMSSILWDWANNIFSGRVQQRDRNREHYFSLITMGSFR